MTFSLPDECFLVLEEKSMSVDFRKRIVYNIKINMKRNKGKWLAREEQIRSSNELMKMKEVTQMTEIEEIKEMNEINDRK